MITTQFDVSMVNHKQFQVLLVCMAFNTLFSLFNKNIYNWLVRENRISEEIKEKLFKVWIWVTIYLNVSIYSHI